MAKKIRVKYSSKSWCFIPKPIVRTKVLNLVQKSGNSMAQVVNDLLSGWPKSSKG